MAKHIVDSGDPFNPAGRAYVGRGGDDGPPDNLDKLKSATVVDQESAVKALKALIDTIEVTGGLVEQNGTTAPAADEDWSDLADAYEAACAAFGFRSMVTREADDDGDAGGDGALD